MTTAVDQAFVASLSEAQWRMTPQGQWVATLIHSGVAEDCHTSLRVILMPPGHHSGAHVHAGHEVQVRVDMGYACSLIGNDLTPRLHATGDPIQIAPGVVHAAVNLSTTHWCAAVETFSDPDDEDVVPLPARDKRVAEIARGLQREYAAEAALHGGDHVAMAYQAEIAKLGAQLAAGAGQ